MTEQQLAITASLHSSADDAIKFARYHDVDCGFLPEMFLADMTGQELVERNT